jgi:S-adenosyl-L-methionine hydrolase (adenosine-forming)
MRPVITLTTDFGINDPFVGIMKGVILNICPKAEIVDITHSIAPQNLFQAAHALKESVSYFPSSSIHLAVVDPGVGGSRKGLAIKTEKYFFIGPDNGIFSPFLESFQAVELTNQDVFLKPVSATFHGRDIFSPVAAWIANGKPFEKLGKILEKPTTLVFAEPKLDDQLLKGEVIYQDHFGNLTTNISKELVSKCLGDNLDNIKIYLKNETKIPLVFHYELGLKNSLSALINSWDKIEIFCNQGNASEAFKISVGDQIEIKRDLT